MKEVLAVVGFFFIWGSLSQFFTDTAFGRVVGWILYSPVAYLLLIVGFIVIPCILLMFLKLGIDSVAERINIRILRRISIWSDKFYGGVEDQSERITTRFMTPKGFIITFFLLITGYGFYMYSTLAPIYAIAKAECPSCTIYDVIEYKAIQDLPAIKKE